MAISVGHLINVSTAFEAFNLDMIFLHCINNNGPKAKMKAVLAV